MLGYIGARKAVSLGFTHHGKYFGIPVWLSEDGEGGLMVSPKWAPMEYVMICFHYVEGVMASLLYPDDEPVFRFMVGREIESD